uniref:Uncharacterized protein n=1 Tax=Anguilla anguilla TaxID=7936 RepID=A0A0E9UWE2_ANGAN
MQAGSLWVLSSPPQLQVTLSDAISMMS